MSLDVTLMSTFQAMKETSSILSQEIHSLVVETEPKVIDNMIHNKSTVRMHHLH